MFEDFCDGDLPKAFLCPLTDRIMEDPVVISTGQSFEKKAILVWFGRGRSTDPITGKKLVTKDLVPNINLRLLIQQIPEDLVEDQKGTGNF